MTTPRADGSLPIDDELCAAIVREFDTLHAAQREREILDKHLDPKGTVYVLSRRCTHHAAVIAHWRAETALKETLARWANAAARGEVGPFHHTLVPLARTWVAAEPTERERAWQRLWRTTTRTR